MSNVSLVEFLRARLDDDERLAQAAKGHQWTVQGDDDGFDEPWVSSEGDDPRGAVTHHPDGGHPSGSVLGRNGAHMARHDPSRVLAEVAAKRAILDQTLAYEAKIDGEWACCHEPDEIAAGLCPETPPGEIRLLRLLAAPYADHSDFDRSWTEMS